MHSEMPALGAVERRQGNFNEKSRLLEYNSHLIHTMQWVCFSGPHAQHGSGAAEILWDSGFH